MGGNQLEKVDVTHFCKPTRIQQHKTNHVRNVWAHEKKCIGTELKTELLFFFNCSHRTGQFFENLPMCDPDNPVYKVAMSGFAQIHSKELEIISPFGSLVDLALWRNLEREREKKILTHSQELDNLSSPQASLG